MRIGTRLILLLILCHNLYYGTEGWASTEVDLETFYRQPSIPHLLAPDALLMERLKSVPSDITIPPEKEIIPHIQEKVPPGKENARYRITDQKGEYRAIGVIRQRNFDYNVPYLGTGTLIGPNVVITAAHVIVNNKAEDIEFIPSADGKRTPFGIFRIKQTYISPEYKQGAKDNQKHDYALLVLDFPIGNYTGWFGIACFNHIQLAQLQKTNQFRIFGYPQDLILKTDKTWNGEYQLYGHEDRVVDLSDPEQFTHQFATFDGQSGSIVFFKHIDRENKISHYIMGIHVGGFEKELKENNKKIVINFAARINKKKYDQICQWLFEAIPKYPLFHSISDWESRFKTICSKHLVQLREHVEGKKLGVTFTGYDASVEGMLQMSQASKPFMWSLRVQDGKVLLPRLFLFLPFLSVDALFLADNNMGDDGLITLARYLPKMPNTRALYLGKNGITKAGISALAPILPKTNIMALFLDNNELDDEAVQILAPHIRDKIVILSLAYNYIGDNGAKALTRFLSPKVRSLFMNDNRISGEGAKSFARYCSHIRFYHLDLSNNAISFEGAQAITRTLPNNETKINLENNMMNTEQMKILESLSAARL